MYAWPRWLAEKRRSAPNTLIDPSGVKRLIGVIVLAPRQHVMKAHGELAPVGDPEVLVLDQAGPLVGIGEAVRAVGDDPQRRRLSSCPWKPCSSVSTVSPNARRAMMFSPTPLVVPMMGVP